MRKIIKLLALFTLLMLTTTLGFWWLKKPIEGPSLPPIVVSEESLKFAVMSDIHSDLVTLNRALARAKADKATFVIITGDLTIVGSKEELLAVKKSLDDSGLPYYAVPGNHDLWLSRKMREPLFEEVFGRSFQTVFLTNYADRLQISKDYKLITINNGDDIGGVDKTQMAWIKREVADCLKLYCLVFLHEPLNHPTSEHVMGESGLAVASQAATLRQLFKDSGIKEIFAGHLHSSSHYTVDGLTTTIVGAASIDRNWQTPRFVEVVISNGELSRQEVEVN